jgi:hypothetical protein
VLLDDLWLADLVFPVQAPSTVKTTPDAARTNVVAARGLRVDWADALAVPNLYGREWELAQF